MDVAAPKKEAIATPEPVAEPPASVDSEPAGTKTPALAAKPKQKPTPPKQSGNSAGAAIFATVVIVIALAAMATYAYLKQQNKL